MHSTSTPQRGSVLVFDRDGRRSSRKAAADAAAAVIARNERNKWERAQRAEVRRLAKALAVPESAIDADGACLYYFGPDLAAIEAAYAKGPADGREAMIAALNAYHDLGYDAGLGDGAMFGEHARRG